MDAEDFWLSRPAGGVRGELPEGLNTILRREKRPKPPHPPTGWLYNAARRSRTSGPGTLVEPGAVRATIG